MSTAEVEEEPVGVCGGPTGLLPSGDTIPVAMSDRGYRLYTFDVAAHHIPPRWNIPQHTGELYARSDLDAKIWATRTVHIREGLPPWRPLLRVTYRHVTVSRVTEHASMPLKV